MDVTDQGPGYIPLCRTGPGDGDLDYAALSSSAPPTDFAGSVAQLSRVFLGDRLPQLESIAAVMGVSARTLQRRLAEHGVEFSVIVDRIRQDEAMQMLGDAARGLTDIALDLGYSDLSSFSRAFRRWTGVSPGRYRRQHPAEQGRPAIADQQ